jgi:acetate kinase
MTSTCFLLAINGGSSSIKFAIFEFNKKLYPLLTGRIHEIGSDKVSFLTYHDDKTKNISKMIGSADYNSAISILIDWLKEFTKDKQILAVGHRIVFGGHKYSSPQQITNDLLKELRDFSPINPNHLPEQILLVEAMSDTFFHQPQIACFDTYFHKDMPTIAQLLPIPRRYFDQGIRRYGFHGLSCEYLIKALTELDGSYIANGHVILAHLGSGVSVTAVYNGKCVDTSMSLTPCSGVPMATRSGDVDPGLFFYLAQAEGMNPTQINNMMTSESGLKGISETTGNIRNLLKLQATDKHAADAVNFFCYHVKKYICMMAGAMGGVTTLVFSGGIGENSPEIRACICEKLGFIGVVIDSEKNTSNNHIISTPTSEVLVRIIPTDEEFVIAQHVYDVLNEKKFGNCEF